MNDDKVLNNQNGIEPCTYILVHLDYSSQYLLPIEQALDLIRMLSNSRAVVEEYEKPLKINEKPPSIRITFYTASQLNVLAVQQGLVS